MNKSTRKTRQLIRKCQKKNIGEITLQVPVKNYHSNKEVIDVIRPVSLANSDGVISKNEQKNMQQKVYKNTNSSATFHEPISQDNPIVFRKHNYLEYRQNPKFQSK